MTIADFTICRDDPDAPPGIRWREIHAKLPHDDFVRFSAWFMGQTTGNNGVYVDDFERFLRGVKDTPLTWD